MELILGTVILAIIVVPLLHVFVTGASTEYKSRKYGEATEAAQNLAEQVQAADADLLLSNSRAVDPQAYFYSLSDLSTGSNGVTTAPASDASGKYYIGIKNYSYGGSLFNALITLDTSATATGTANTTPVIVGNQMDASIDMTQAETGAADTLLAECGNLAVTDPNSLTLSYLTRSVTLNVTRTAGSSANTYSYRIEALFTYTETIPYKIGAKSYNYYFSHTEQALASVVNITDSTDNSPVFSSFVFFNAYYRSSMATETILINNSTGQDINFFLVNTNTTGSMPLNYGALVWYKYQKFLSHVPVNKLIYTNLPYNKVIYRAAENEFLRKTLTVSGYLVETKQLNRKFAVDIKLYKSGAAFTGTVLAGIDSTKLNY